MTMNPEFVEQLSAWLAATDIEALELRGPDTLLRLRREGARVVCQAAGATSTEAVAPTAAIGAATGAGTPVTATSVGVFLRQHPLHAAPLVTPGSVVRAGQTLGLLQVSSLLLEVTTPRDGVVGATKVEHGTVVGHGTVLFELQPPA